MAVPLQRTLAKKYWKDLSLVDLDKLIKSKIHEERLIALLILVAKFSTPSQDVGRGRGEVDKSEILNLPRLARLARREPRRTRVKAGLKSEIYKFYMSHVKFVNNWDLVDLSTPNIVGAYLFDKNRSTLFKLAKSKKFWQRRIAILATFYFIYRKQPQDSLKIAAMLLKDKHDLIHKAVGWMLREVGKRCGEKFLINFLDRHHGQMPRTMLRYAIERFPKTKRKKYLNML